MSPKTTPSAASVSAGRQERLEWLSRSKERRKLLPHRTKCKLDYDGLQCAWRLRPRKCKRGSATPGRSPEIGRASCRERGESAGGGGAVERKRSCSGDGDV